MYYILIFFLKLVAYTPSWLQYIFSDILFYPFYYIVRYRRKIVRRNLEESFPEKSKEELIDIEKKFYHFLLDLVFESCKQLVMSPEEQKRRAVFKNMDEVNAVLDRGRSISAFIAHYGNWEWMTSFRYWLTDSADVVQIYHKFKNKAMERVMLQLRNRLGNISVLRDETVRYIAKASKQERPMIVGFLSDQSPKRRESKFFIPFLNHNVPILTGTEKLTKHFDFSAYYLSARRVRRGYYEYEFSLLCEDTRSLPDYELTRLYFERLEQEIRRQPELYLWSHNRFKYAKDLEKS